MGFIDLIFFYRFPSPSQREGKKKVAVKEGKREEGVFSSESGTHSNFVGFLTLSNVQPYVSPFTKCVCVKGVV
jgi:hypothetical protein